VHAGTGLPLGGSGVPRPLEGTRGGGTHEAVQLTNGARFGDVWAPPGQPLRDRLTACGVGRLAPAGAAGADRVPGQCA
jgi:hypothetical protein